MQLELNGQTLTLPHYPAPVDLSLKPADALLRESDAGQSQHSPKTQYEQIASAMAKNGHYPACIDGDERKGHIAARRGYQNIKSRVDAGLTTAVYVVHSSRLGRDASERLALQRALKKLRVPIYSCQQGEIRADLVGGVYALMDEQFSVDLAYKIKNAMPQAVKNGLYPTRTPVGYKRVWPQGSDATYDRKSRPDMVIDEHYGPLVQDIFRKYGYEGWTIRSIVGWLNGQRDRYPNPNSTAGLWNINWLCRMLRMSVYVGEIVYGRTKTGYYDHYDGPVLRSGEDGCQPARHEALIERPLWEAVQARSANEHPQRTTVTRKGRRPALLSGILVCRGCGGRMRALHNTPGGRGGSQYVCVAREKKQSDCSEPDCSLHVADAAVLRELARLVPGRPWERTTPEELAVQDPQAVERERLEAQLAAARREVVRNIRLLKLIEEPDDATLEEFRRDNRALDERIKSLQAMLAALPRTTVDPITIEDLHARLSGADLPGRIAAAQEAGDTMALRELLGVTVESARIVERKGGGRNGKTGWARAEVVWTAQVERLLEAGYLRLDAPPEAPPATSAAERMRRYRARQRAERAGQSLDGLLSVDQAAQELGMTPGSLRSAIVRGVITPVRLEAYPRRAFLTPQEVERYRAQHLGRRGRRRKTT